MWYFHPQDLLSRTNDHSSRWHLRRIKESNRFFRWMRAAPTPQLWTLTLRLFGPFFWDGTLSSFLGVWHSKMCGDIHCMSPYISSLNVRVSKWGSKSLPIPIKAATLLTFSYPQLRESCFITSTFTASVGNLSLANFACTRTSSAARTIFI